MAQAIRNLQLFRNGALMVGSINTVKGLIENAFTNGTLTLYDGEPISIRYKETSASTVVKGLYGIAYNDGTTKKILWTGNDTVVATNNTNATWVTLNVTEDPTGTFTLAAVTDTETIANAGGNKSVINTIYDANGNVVPASDIVPGTTYYTDAAHTTVAKYGVDYTYDDGLVTATDVKAALGNMARTTVASANGTVIITDNSTTDAYGNTVHNYDLSVDAAQDEYSIGIATTTEGYLKSYQLEKTTPNTIASGVTLYTRSDSEPYTYTPVSVSDLVSGTTYYKDQNGTVAVSGSDYTIGDTTPVGAKIDIPKDFLVKSANIIDVSSTAPAYQAHVATSDITVTDNDEYYTLSGTTYTRIATGQTIESGETYYTKLPDGKYIDFVINVKEGSATDEHIYLNVQDLVDVYTAGDGIAISANNEISVRIHKGLKVCDGTDGDLTTSGAIEIKLSTDNGNGLKFGTDSGLYTGSVISQVVTNYTDDSIYYTATNGDIDEPTTTQPSSGSYVAVPVGKRYLLILSNNGTLTGIDITEDHVTSFAKGQVTPTTGDPYDALIITMASGTSYNVPLTDLQIDGVVVNNQVSDVTTGTVTANTDTLSVTTKGVLTQAGLTQIENYIDHYDCGTFNLSVDNGGLENNEPQPENFNSSPFINN